MDTSNNLFEVGIINDVLECGMAEPYTISSIYKPLTRFDDGLRCDVFCVEEKKQEIVNNQCVSCNTLHHQYNEEGLRIYHEENIYGDIGRYSYEYSDGILMHVKLLRNGYVNEQWRFLYDKTHLSKVDCRVYESEGCIETHEIIPIKCNERGCVVEENGREKRQYTYDSLGHVLTASPLVSSLSGFTSLVVPSWEYKFEFDNYGLLIKKQIRYGNTTLCELYNRNKNGDIIDVETTRSDGHQETKHMDYTYDDKGNWITCRMKCQNKNFFVQRVIAYFDEV